MISKKQCAANNRINFVFVLRGVIKLKRNILVVTLTLFLATFFFGCKNEHEVESKTEDKYGYTGTWIGKTSPNSFTIVDMFRKDEREKPYMYDLLVFTYSLSLRPGEQIHNGKNALQWTSIMDLVREAEAREDGSLFVYGGFAGGDNRGIRNTAGGQIMRLDGNKLIISQDGITDSVVFEREDDYDDLLDSVDDLKEEISSEIRKAIRTRYPDAELAIVDNSEKPHAVIK